MGLPRRQHPRLVHHDQGLGADLHLPLCSELEKLVDAVGARDAVVSQRHRRPPCHRSRHDLVAVLPVQVGDGPERGGLARARRALDHRNTAAPYRRVADRQRLLLAQRIALFQQRLDLLLDRLFRKTMPGVRRHGPRHVAHRLLQTEIVAGGIDLGMGHARPGLGRRLLRLQPLDLRVAPQPLDGRPHRLPAQQSRRRVRRRLHHVRPAEDRFLARKMGGQVVEPVGQRPDRLAGDVDLVSGHRGDQLLPLAVTLGFSPPAAVAYLRVVVVGLALARDLVDPRHPRGIAERGNAELPRHRYDGLAPLRPERLEVVRHARDAGELIGGAVLLHPDAQPLLQLPRQVRAEHRPGRLLPAVDRVLVMGTPLAVLVRPGHVENRAVDVKLRVVLPARAVDEGGAHQVRLGGPAHAALLDARIAAMPEHRVFQRRPRRGRRHRLDLQAHLRLGDGPEGGHALVHREGHVDAGGTVGAAGPAHQLAGPVGREAVVKALELSGVDLDAVLHPEQALGVEPGAVRLLARRVVLVGMPEGALALQVVLGRRHLPDGGYHGSIFPVPPQGAAMGRKRGFIAVRASRLFPSGDSATEFPPKSSTRNPMSPQNRPNRSPNVNPRSIDRTGVQLRLLPSLSSGARISCQTGIPTQDRGDRSTSRMPYETGTGSSLTLRGRRAIMRTY